LPQTLPEPRAEKKRRNLNAEWTIVGVFASGNATFDVCLMVMFGVLGYLMRKFGYARSHWCWPLCWDPCSKTI
jgi:Tripartite tricarboxylate transporter TctA family